MFGWLFRKKESENYEVLLSTLASDIAERRARLADIRQRQRRSAFWLTCYAVGIWAVYVGLWYAKLVPNIYRPAPGQDGVPHKRTDAINRAIKGVPVLVGPILILFMRRIVQAWYTRIGNAEETTLKNLATKQRTTIEDIKKKTNYYSTRNLLERYDDTVGNTPKKKPNPALAAQHPGGIPGAPPQAGQPSPLGPPGSLPLTPPRPGQPMAAPGQTVQPGAALPPGMLANPAQQPLVPARRQWYDRLADAMLGEDAEGPAGKYALICGRCFAHNGLVKEEAWSQTKYTCPKCGFFNDPTDHKSDGATLSSSASMPAVPRGGEGVKKIPNSATMPSLRSSVSPSKRRSPRAKHARSPLSASVGQEEEGATDDDEDADRVEGDVSREDGDEEGSSS